MRVGSAIQYGADEARLEAREIAHGLAGRLAQYAQLRWLIVAVEKTLVFAQRLLDLAVLRQARFIECMQAFGSLALGELIVADAVFTDQARGFQGDAAAHIRCFHRRGLILPPP